MMKKICKYLLGMLLLIGLGFGYVQYKFITAENSVTNYLVHIKPEMSYKTEPFIANLPGDKNWMVSVKIEGEARTYFYYVNKKKQLVLESYVENGIEYVENRVVK